MSDIYNSDSSLDIEINSVEDNSNIYSASDDSYEVVKQWKLQVTVKMSWYDIKSSQIIFIINILFLVFLTIVVY